MITIKLTVPQWEVLKEGLMEAEETIQDSVGQEGLGWNMRKQKTFQRACDKIGNPNEN